jgi:hypothetical protein
MGQHPNSVEPDLMDLAEDAVEQVGAAIVAGAPLVRCQLLASEFYDAVRRALDATPPSDNAARRKLTAVLDQCGRAGKAAISPSLMFSALEAAARLLRAGPAPTPSQRPVLRVIQGGLA